MQTGPVLGVKLRLAASALGHLGLAEYSEGYTINRTAVETD